VLVGVINSLVSKNYLFLPHERIVIELFTAMRLPEKRGRTCDLIKMDGDVIGCQMT